MADSGLDAAYVKVRSACGGDKSLSQVVWCDGLRNARDFSKSAYDPRGVVAIKTTAIVVHEQRTPSRFPVDCTTIDMCTYGPMGEGARTVRRFMSTAAIGSPS